MIYLVVLAIFVKRNWINKFIGAGVLHGEILAFQNRETVFQVACWFSGGVHCIYLCIQKVCLMFFLNRPKAIYEGR